MPTKRGKIVLREKYSNVLESKALQAAIYISDWETRSEQYYNMLLFSHVIGWKYVKTIDINIS